MSTAQEAGTFHVRLVPYNPQQGHVLRKYGYRGTLYRGGDRPDWYIVTPALAKELAVIRQIHDDPRSPMAFEVYAEKDRQRVDAMERERYLAAIGFTQAAPPAIPPLRTFDITGQDRQGVPVPEGALGRAAAIPAQAPPPQAIPAPAVPVEPPARLEPLQIPQADPTAAAPNAEPPPAPEPGAITTAALPGGSGRSRRAR